MLPNPFLQLTDIQLSVCYILLSLILLGLLPPLGYMNSSRFLIMGHTWVCLGFTPDSILGSFLAVRRESYKVQGIKPGWGLTERARQVLLHYLSVFPTLQIFLWFTIFISFGYLGAELLSDMVIMFNSLRNCQTFPFMLLIGPHPAVIWAPCRAQVHMGVGE